MASTKVRGISIELSADASGIVKGLKQANSSIKETQKELRDIDKLLKINPTNLTLIKQRTKELQAQITNTKTKLQELKKAEADMKSKGVDENSEQFRALQREIISTQNELDKLEKTGGSGSSTLFAVSQAAGQVGEKATKAGKALMPVTAGIAAVGTAAVKTASDFDSQMSKVAAISGAVGEDFDKLRDKAREMGAKTKFSASEAGAAFEYMAMAGWKTEDMLDGIEGIMNLAAASGEDLATTSDIVTDALTAFGYSAEDAGHFADVLAAASANANTNVGMLGESFKYVAPVAGALGYSAEDTSIALGLMANSGIKASQAGTTLRTLLTNMAKPTDTMAQAMEVLGVSLDDGEGNMKSFREVMLDLRRGFKDLKIPEEDALKALEDLDAQLEDGTITQDQYNSMVADWTKYAYGAEGALKAEAAASLAGARGMSGLLAIVNASEDDFNSLTNAIDNSSGSAEKMADRMQDNLGGQLTILKSQLQELAISFGDILMPVIRSVVEKIQGFIDKLNNMDDSQKQTIATIGAIVAAVAPALLIFGKFATAISAITKVMSTLKFTAFLTNPVTIAIAAIAGLVAGIKALDDALYNNNSQLAGYEEELGKISKANDELSDSIAESKKQLEGKVTASEAEASAAEKLMDKLNELMTVEDKDAGHKEAIKSIVEELNELVPDLGLAYDEEADKLNKTNAEIKRNIDLRKQQAQADAYMEAYTESLKKAAEAEMQAAEAQETFNKMYHDASPEVKELYDYVQEYGEEAAKQSNKITSSGKAISAVYMNQKKDLDLLVQANGEITEAQEMYNNETERSEWLNKKWLDVNEELTASQKEVAKALNKTDLKGFREELAKTFGSTLPKELNKALNLASTYGVEIPKELQEGILDGSVDVENAIDEINKLVDSGLKENEPKIKEDGKRGGGQYVEGISTNKSASNKAGKDLATETKTGAGSVDLKTTGSQRGGHYIEGVDSKRPAAKTSGTNLAKETKSGASSVDLKPTGSGNAGEYNSGVDSQKENSKKKGVALATSGRSGAASVSYWDTGAGRGKNFNSGLDSKGVKQTLWNTGERVSKYGRSGANSVSYWDTGAGRGNNFNSGLGSKGVKDGSWSKGQTLATSGRSGAASVSFYSTGENAGQGFINGLIAKKGLIGGTAAAIAAVAKTAMENNLKVNSPSKVTEKIGRYFGEGFAIGIEKSTKDAINAASALAGGAVDGIGDFSALTANQPIALAGAGAVGAQSVVNNNYTQNNYSPKALSTSDIYRQTNNLLSLTQEVIA